MKTMLWCSTVVPATLEERRARRPIGRDNDAYAAMLESVQRHAIWADELGFDAFGTVEHHFQIEGGEALPNNLLFYAKLAAQTQRIKFVPMSVVLTATNPIRTAEDLALFDHMYPDRVGVCFARGYQSRWMQTLSQRENVTATRQDPKADALNREIFDEYLEIVEKAWSEDSFNYAGEHYQVPFPATGIPNWPAAEWTREFGDPGDIDEDGTVRRIGVMPKLARPLDIFMPTTGSSQTVINAARSGRTALTMIGDRESFLRTARLYHQEAQASGRDIELGKGFGAVANVILGDTYEEAFEHAVQTYGYWFHRFFHPFGFNEGLRVPSDPPGPLTFDDERALTQRMVEQGSVLCGTPDSVIEQLGDLRRCYADGSLEWFVWSPYLQCLPPSEETTAIQRRQMKLFAEHIMPVLA